MQQLDLGTLLTPKQREYLVTVKESAVRWRWTHYAANPAITYGDRLIASKSGITFNFKCENAPQLRNRREARP